MSAIRGRALTSCKGGWLVFCKYGNCKKLRLLTFGMKLSVLEFLTTKSGRPMLSHLISSGLMLDLYAVSQQIFNLSVFYVISLLVYAHFEREDKFEFSRENIEIFRSPSQIDLVLHHCWRATRCSVNGNIKMLNMNEALTIHSFYYEIWNQLFLNNRVDEILSRMLLDCSDPDYRYGFPFLGHFHNTFGKLRSRRSVSCLMQQSTISNSLN